MKYLCLYFWFLLAACGPSAGDTGPGGVSVEDARALDAAAEKLDAEAQLAPPVQVPAPAIKNPTPVAKNSEPPKK
jgi:hypothetical protein